jgi:hypothetical protein
VACVNAADCGRSADCLSRFSRAAELGGAARRQISQVAAPIRRQPQVGRLRILPSCVQLTRVHRTEFRSVLNAATLEGVGSAAAVAARTQYLARPGRRAVVVTDLASLRGPVRGTVELPLRLFWSSPDRSFDLDRPFPRRWLYQTVLREASRPEDLTGYLDRDILIGLWPQLRVPAGVRRAWEELHPVLRGAVPGNS